MLVYVAGKYSGNVTENIEIAKKVAIELWSKGHSVICPHTNSGFFENGSSITYDMFLNGYLEIMRRCDVIIMLENWKDSKGATIEYNYAKELKKPIYFYPSIPDLHPTEINCPEQCKSFMEIIMKMYDVHLEKNSDYSPANILATGELGLVTRLWDKIARLLNLYGFRFKIEKGTYDKPKNPKNESIEDTLMDNAVYSIIGLILRTNKWGK